MSVNLFAIRLHLTEGGDFLRRGVKKLFGTLGTSRLLMSFTKAFHLSTPHGTLGTQITTLIKIRNINTSGEKLPPYLRLPEKAIAYSVAIKVSK